jgi:GntR family transcriptional repressor for pyruvate dehydrogenase complex
MSEVSTPASPNSAVDAVVVGVLSAIVDDALDAGASLPSEAELASRFNVSRLTLREAMKTLSALGVVTIERGRGTFVNPCDRWSRVHPAVLAMLVRTPEDMAATSRSLVEARRLVEVGVAELAAERRNDVHLTTLNEQLEAMWGAHESADANAWACADLAFHDTLMEAAGNPFVTMLFTPLEQMLRRDRHEPATEPTNRRRALRWHQRILDAVVDADPRSAREAMDGHLRDTQEILAQWRADDDSVSGVASAASKQGAPE